MKLNGCKCGSTDFVLWTEMQIILVLVHCLRSVTKWSCSYMYKCLLVCYAWLVNVCLCIAWGDLLFLLQLLLQAQRGQSVAEQVVTIEPHMLQ